MGEAFIVRRGGGSSGKLFAVIAVTYPEGSACTCTKGEKVLKAKDTSGRALFSVSIGTWVVSCTDGTDTASKEVSITAEGQGVNVELNYSYYLFKEGSGLQHGATIDKLADNGNLTGKNALIWANANQTNVGNELQFLPAIDFSKYETLTIELAYTAQYSGSHSATLAVTEKFRTGEAFGYWDTLSKQATKKITYSTSRQTVSLSVAAISGNCHVTFYGFGCTGEIYNIYLK